MNGSIDEPQTRHLGIFVAPAASDPYGHGLTSREHLTYRYGESR
jgi:hypothetical protein